MEKNKTIFDTKKARENIEKGKRAKWWRRKGSKSKGFHYVDANGAKITAEKHLERIKSLVVPPAWQHVRICPAASSSLQAVGMDTNGRIQYLYHPKFSEKQQQKKFAKIEKFGEYLPGLRQLTNEHLNLEGFSA